MSITPEFAADLLSKLEEMGIPHAVGGSYASSAWGQPRQTHDLDLVVVVNSDSLKKLADEFGEEYALSQEEMQSALDSSAEFRTFQFLQPDLLIKIDFFLLPPSEYTFAMLERVRRYPLTATYNGCFESPEDIIIAKLRWFELGNRVSDKQWNDIVQVLEMQHGELDEEYLNHWAEHFGLRELLDEARSQAITD